MYEFYIHYNRWTDRYTLYIKDEVNTQIEADTPDAFTAYLEYIERHAQANSSYEPAA